MLGDTRQVRELRSLILLAIINNVYAEKEDMLGDSRLVCRCGYADSTPSA